MIEDYNMSKFSLRPVRTALLLLLSVALFGDGPVEAQSLPVQPGSIVLDLRGPSRIFIDSRTGCDDEGGGSHSGDADGGGGPVSSPIDINDVMVIPPKRLQLEHDSIIWDDDGNGQSELRVAGLCTETRKVFTNLCGERFGVKAKAVPNATPGHLELYPSTASGGGTFLLDLPLRLEITLTSLDVAGRVFVLDQGYNVKSSGRFSRENLPGGLDLSEPTPLDVDCDGAPEETLPAGSDLFLGIDGDQEAPFCLTEFGASICVAPAKAHATPGGSSGTTAR